MGTGAVQGGCGSKESFAFRAAVVGKGHLGGQGESGGGGDKSALKGPSVLLHCDGQYGWHCCHMDSSGTREVGRKGEHPHRADKVSGAAVRDRSGVCASPCPLPGAAEGSAGPHQSPQAGPQPHCSTPASGASSLCEQYFVTSVLARLCLCQVLPSLKPLETRDSGRERKCSFLLPAM